MADENLWPDGENDVCIVSMPNLDTKDKDKKFINWKNSKLFNIDKAEVMEKNQQNQRWWCRTGLYESVILRLKRCKGPRYGIRSCLTYLKHASMVKLSGLKIIWLKTEAAIHKYIVSFLVHDPIMIE